MRGLVAAWKERGLRLLAVEAAAVVTARVPAPRGAVVACVPPDHDRRRVRGHHPAAGLAEALAERWDVPCEALLERARRIERQRGLGRSERRRNVEGAFRPARAMPACVVLVDDVYTSGATAHAAAAALRTGGARRVEVVTFARAIRMPQLGLDNAGRRSS
ncbi:MAG: ComF family protein [Gaiellaceae bacterium]